MKTVHSATAEAKGGCDWCILTADSRSPFDFATSGSLSRGAVLESTPEELFAYVYSARLGRALEYVAGLHKISVEAAVVRAVISLNSGDSGYSISASLNVVMPELDELSAHTLVAAAYQVCPYSKAMRGNIDVTLTVNDMPISCAF